MVVKGGSRGHTRGKGGVYKLEMNGTRYFRRWKLYRTSKNNNNARDDEQMAHHFGILKVCPLRMQSI